MKEQIIREVLPRCEDFKTFWQKKGPFKYALTSREFPPILLESEEWLFGNNVAALFQELMEWHKRKMKMVFAPFSVKKKGGFRPENLAPWRINHFPQEWATAQCRAFTPVGHLTAHVESFASSTKVDAMTQAFFEVLKDEIQDIGYILLESDPHLLPGFAYVDDYLKEWMEDEAL